MTGAFQALPVVDVAGLSSPDIAARRHQGHALARACHLLVQAAQSIHKRPHLGAHRNHPQPNLIADQHHGATGLCQGIQKHSYWCNGYASWMPILL